MRQPPSPNPYPLHIAWTGHRPELFADPEAVVTAVFARAAALAAPQTDRLAFHCGGQRGVDTWAADAAQRLGIALHLYLPLPAEVFAGGWSAEDRAALERTLDYAVERVVLDPDGKQGDAAYSRRNRLLAERCALLIALWTGLGGGGTAETVAAARALHRVVEEHHFAPSGHSPRPGERGV